MLFTRRQALATAAASALNSGAGKGAFAQATDDFDIDAAFEGFMNDLGRSAADGGGTVTFTGRDPILSPWPWTGSRLSTASSCRRGWGWATSSPSCRS